MRVALAVLVAMTVLVVPSFAQSCPGGISGGGLFTLEASQSADPSIKYIFRAGGNDGFDLDWGYTSPHECLGDDNFDIFASGVISLQAGEYEYTVSADDGVRLTVDGEVLIDEYNSHPLTVFSARKTYPTSGPHIIRIEYFEATEYAALSFHATRLSTAIPASAVLSASVNGIPAGNIMDVDVGDVILFQWSGEGGTPSSLYDVNGPQCASPAGVFPWGATTLSGVTSAAVQDCQAGRTYRITYKVTPPSGDPADATLVVRVRQKPTRLTLSPLSVAQGSSYTGTFATDFNPDTLSSAVFDVKAEHPVPGGRSMSEMLAWQTGISSSHPVTTEAPGEWKIIQVRAHTDPADQSGKYFSLAVPASVIVTGTAPPANCGNGLVNVGEECDCGSNPLCTNPGGNTCTSIGRGFTSGTLRCFTSGIVNECKFDISSCSGSATGTPLVSGLTIAPSTVAQGASYTATFTGSNLANAWIDVIADTPSGTNAPFDNWQLGPQQLHTVVSEAPGVYTIKGARAHVVQSDHTGSYSPVSASVTVTATQTAVRSRILEPASGSTKSATFTLKVVDEPAADVQRCEYQVSVKNAQGAYQISTPWTDRPCGLTSSGTTKDIQVRSADCTTSGPNACKIEVRAVSKTNVPGATETVTITIDFDKPATSIEARSGWIAGNFDIQITDTDPTGGSLSRCEYKIESGPTGRKTGTLGWTQRTCSSRVTVTVGTDGQCRHEGADTCTVIARSFKGTLASEEVAQNYSVLFSTVQDRNLPMSTLSTTSGIRFTATSSRNFLTFRVCPGSSGLDECKNAFTASTSGCGLNRPCLCGSLTSYSCEVACSGQVLTYYGMLTSADGSVFISPIQSVTCPRTQTGTIVDMITRFQAIDTELTRLIGENDVVCRSGPEEQRQFFCDKTAALKQAQRLVRDHVQWLTTVQNNPSAAILQDAERRSQDLLQTVNVLMTGGSLTTLRLNITAPMSTLLNQPLSLPARIMKTGTLPAYGRVDCTITPPTGTTLRRTSSCLLATEVSSFPSLPPPPPSPTGNVLAITGLQTGGGAVAASYSIDFTPAEAGVWRVACLLLMSFRSDCTSAFEEDRVTKSIDITSMLKTTITEVSVPATVPRSSLVKVWVNAANPDASTAYGIASCQVRSPSATTTQRSDCTAIPGGGHNNLTISFPATVTGTWTVDRCTISASSAAGCGGSQPHASAPDVKSFSVVEPTTLIIGRVQTPVSAIVNREAALVATVFNPLGDRYAAVSCSMTTPAGPLTVDGCKLINESTEDQLALPFTPATKGTWTITSCSIGSSLDNCVTSATQQTITAVGSFAVTGGRALQIESVTAPPDVPSGAVASFPVILKNPTDITRFGRVRCTFRRPDNTADSNSSACISVASGASVAAPVTLFMGIRGTWTLESCRVEGATNAQCTGATIDDTRQVAAAFTAAIGANPARDVTIIAARPVGNVVRGEFGKAEVTVRNPVAPAVYAIASCTFRSPSGQTRTGSSICGRVDANSQRVLFPEARMDETGSWNITSCEVRATTNDDCSAALLNDTRSNIGSFHVTLPTTLIVSRIVPQDVLNGSTETITVTVENPLNDNRFGRVNCQVRRPSGTVALLSASCSGVASAATTDFMLETTANEIGTWQVLSCSVAESTNAQCTGAATVHTANGTSFVVSRGDRLTFVDEILFPLSVQNNSMMGITAFGRNPSASDLFGQLRCILIAPSGANVYTNGSCTLIPPGTSSQPFSLAALITQAGGWDIQSCSLLGSLSPTCSDSSVHATRTGVGTFISIGPRVENLSVGALSITRTIIRGGTASITIEAKNYNDFPQYAQLRCTVVPPTGAPLNLTSACRPIAAQGMQTLAVNRTVTEIGSWNISACRIFASDQPTCSVAFLQNSTHDLGSFEVVMPTTLIVRSASGPSVLNASTANITAHVENPLADRRFAEVACSLRAPSGRMISLPAVCFGLNPGEVASPSFAAFIDEVGTWQITTCSIKASTSFDCAGAQLHNSIVGGTFTAARRTNLTFLSATLAATQVFNGSVIRVNTVVRNPAEVDLFGAVSCIARSGTRVVQNTTACTVFRGNSEGSRTLTLAVNAIAAWNVESCTLVGSLESDCTPAERHDMALNLGTVNVTAVPDLYIVGVAASSEFARNVTADAAVRVRNDGIPIYARATCTIAGPARTFVNSSGCSLLQPGITPLHVPFFADRLGEWRIYSCYVNASANDSCAPSRQHNTSNLTAATNVTGKTLQIEEVIEPDGGALRIGDRIEIPVRVRNIDALLHKGFVNCSLRTPDGSLKEIDSAIQTIPVGDTRIFKPSFIAESTGQWRLISCTVFRTESPAYREDTKTVDRIFLVGAQVRPGPIQAACSQNADCPGDDLRCYCSGGGCHACPAGTTCRNHACEDVTPPQCTFDSDCAIGQQCDLTTRSCMDRPQVATCYNNDQCSTGLECREGICQSPEPPQIDQMILVLIAVVFIAIAIGVVVFLVWRRRVAEHSVFDELERVKQSNDDEKKAKGIALPVSAIVMISIAMMVVIAVGGLFLTETGGQIGAAEAEQVFFAGCRQYCTQFNSQANHEAASSLKERDPKFLEACEAKGILWRDAAGEAPIRCIEACPCDVAVPSRLAYDHTMCAAQCLGVQEYMGCVVANCRS